MTINIDKEKEEILIRKARYIGIIARKSAIVTLQSDGTYKLAGGIALWQGLKYNGSFGQGVRAGLATAGVLVVTNVCANIMNKYEDIRKI